MPKRNRLSGRTLRRGVWVLTTLVIAVVAYGIGSCSKGSVKSEHDKIVLARVAGKDFTAGDLERKIRYQLRSLIALSGSAAVDQYRQVFKDTVEELCWVQLGEKKGYKNDPVYRETVELSRRWILKDRTIEHEVRTREVPTEDEIRAFYEAHKSEYRVPTSVQVAHVLLASEAEARSIRQRLLKGEPVAELARRYSIDEITKGEGGMVGWITPTGGAGHLGNQTGFNQMAMQLQRGDVSQPVHLPLGWSVLVALDRNEEQIRPLDAVLREAVKKRAQVEKHNKIYNEMMAQMRKEYGVEIYEENYEKYARSLLNEDELFATAQREKDPKRRASTFEEIVRRFPASVRASQAQFMLAFTLAEELKDYDRARSAFQAFLNNYPADDLADSARWMIMNMDKPDIDPSQVDQVRRKALGLPVQQGS